MSKVEDKTWIVKSSGRILGPYTLSEMTELLRARKISIIDEVREPTTRWSFIRENQSFQGIVKALRDEEAHALDQTTEVGSRHNKTVTDVGISINDDLTPTPHPFFETHTLQPAQVKGLDRVLPKNDSPTYRMTSGKKPQVKSEKRSSLSLILGVFALSLTVFIYFLIQNRPLQKSVSFEDLIKLARINKSMGNYEKALVFYNKADALKGLDINSKVQMATLLLEVNSQTIEARRVLEDIMVKISNADPLRIDLQLGIALSYFKEGNLNKALEMYQNILFSNSEQVEARLNSALIKILKSDFTGALKDFMTLHKQGAGEPLVFLGRAIANLGLNEGEVDLDKLKMSLDDLTRLINRTPEYKLESLLIQAVLEQKRGHEAEAEIIVSRLLEEDPRLTRHHLHNLMVDRQIVKWDRLAMYCDYLMTKFSESAISKGLAPFCADQKEEMATAIQRVEDARNQYAHDPYLIGQHAYYLYESRRLPEALQVSKLSGEKSTMSVRVRGKVCEEQANWSCAETEWNSLLAEKPGDLDALRGLARLEFEKNKYEQASDYVRRGLLLSPTYSPLLELRETIGAR